MDKMPIINIVDVIVDVEKWLSLSVHFKPLSGYETKIREYPSRFVATSLSYGCNLKSATNRTLAIKIYSQTNSMALQSSCYRTKINKSTSAFD